MVVLLVVVVEVVVVAGLPHTSAVVVVVVGEAVVVVVGDGVVVVVVAAEQPFVVSVQALSELDHVHRHEPPQRLTSSGRTVVVVVCPGGSVVVVSVGEQSSPIRTMAHRSHVPGSRHKIRAEPHGTARSTSVAPGWMSAN